MWGRRRECRQRVAHRGAKPVGASDSHGFGDRASRLGNQNRVPGSEPVHDQPPRCDTDHYAHESGSSTNTDTDHETESGTDHETGSDTDPDTHTHTDTNPHTHTHTDPIG